jgi:hypothetical protein
MNTRLALSSIVFAAMSVAAVAAHADDADPSGQFAHSVASSTTRAEVRAQLQQPRTAAQAQQPRAVSPWSTAYNPLTTFKGQRTRAEVTAEFLASRDAVEAMTAEDSGSAFLAERRTAETARQFAGQPVNAQ